MVVRVVLSHVMQPSALARADRRRHRLARRPGPRGRAEPRAGRLALPVSGVAWGTPSARGIVAAATLGSGLTLLDGTVVNVALRTMGTDLDASLSQLQWITNGYFLSLASLILLGGSLGDRLGRRRVFVIGTIWFAARLAAVRGGAERRGADRRPGAPGHRRRAAHAGQPGDDPGCLPRRGPQPRDRRLVGPRRDRRRARPARRRPADRPRVVALDLPHQPAARRADRLAGAALGAGDPGPARPRPLRPRRRGARLARPGRHDLGADRRGRPGDGVGGRRRPGRGRRLRGRRAPRAASRWCRWASSPTAPSAPPTR